MFQLDALRVVPRKPLPSSASNQLALSACPEAPDVWASNSQALRPPNTSGMSNGGVGSSIESSRSLWVERILCKERCWATAPVIVEMLGILRTDENHSKKPPFRNPRFLMI